MKCLGTILAGFLLTVSASAQAEELIIAQGEVKEVAAGSMFLDRLELRENATLKLKGSTDIFASTLIAQKGARIVYDNPATYADDGIFVLGTRDASGVDELRILLNGKKAKLDFTPVGDNLKKASYGGDGRAARGADLRKFDKGRPAAPGGTGSPGQKGTEGEDALSVNLFLKGVKPDSTVYVESVGGSGGQGQVGGDGGRGGNGANVYDCRGGGDGGNGGDGGPAGNAGKVLVHLIVANTQGEQAQRAKQGFQIRTNTARGKPGAGGMGGGGGGRGGKGGNPLPCASKDGQKGNPGRIGAEGAGPEPGNDLQMKAWQIVDVISDQDYAIYLDAKQKTQAIKK